MELFILFELSIWLFGIYSCIWVQDG